MFTMTKTENTGLEKARDDALLELKNYTAEDAEYTKIITHVKTLSELIAAEMPERLNPNTIVIAIANSLIAVIVVGYESKNVVTSKFLNFMIKAR